MQKGQLNVKAKELKDMAASYTSILSAYDDRDNCLIILDKHEPDDEYKYYDTRTQINL